MSRATPSSTPPSSPPRSPRRNQTHAIPSKRFPFVGQKMADLRSECPHAGETDPDSIIRLLVGDGTHPPLSVADQDHQRVTPLLRQSAASNNNSNNKKSKSPTQQLPRALQKEVPAAMPEIEALYAKINPLSPLHHFIYRPSKDQQEANAQPVTTKAQVSSSASMTALPEVVSNPERGSDEAILAVLQEFHGGVHVPAFRYYQRCKHDEVLFPSKSQTLTAAISNYRSQYSNIDLSALCSPRREPPRRKILPSVAAERARYKLHTSSSARKVISPSAERSLNTTKQDDGDDVDDDGHGGGHTHQQALTFHELNQRTAIGQSAAAVVDTNLASLLPPPDHNPASSARLHDFMQKNKNRCSSAAAATTTTASAATATETQRQQQQLQRQRIRFWPLAFPPTPVFTTIIEPRTRIDSRKDMISAGKAEARRTGADAAAQLSSSSAVIEEAGRRALAAGALALKAEAVNAEQARTDEARRAAARKRRTERMTREVTRMIVREKSNL